MKIFEEALNKFLSTTKKIAQHLVKKKKIIVLMSKKTHSPGV